MELSAHTIIPFAYWYGMANSRNNIKPEAAQYTWKRRPSELRGYDRTLYVTTIDSDYLRVDYNLKDKLIRLYLEVSGQSRTPYLTVIKNGIINVARAGTSSRKAGVAARFEERAEIFSSIPNAEVLKLINKNYNIIDKGERERAREERKKKLEETRKRYFVEKNPYGSSGNDQDLIKAKIRLVDALDFFAGLFLAFSLFYYYQYSYLLLGIVAAFFGMLTGIVDMVFRNRPPVFPKVIFFILLGAVAYIYGYYIA